MARLFGTDGVRGLANGPVINADTALRLSEAAARVFGRTITGGAQRMTAVVGRDPRASGEFLSAAVIAGLASSGVDVYDVGVLPTPAVAFLTADLGANFGVMLSASHNAMPDNGIKFFALGGHKLPDEVEDRIEAAMDAPADRPTGAAVGRVHRVDDGAERYVAHLLKALPHELAGLHVVVDAAHGAASEVGPDAFRRAGAQVTVIGAEPDGLNINDGYGSTHLDKLKQAVVEAGADFGVAFDGDADRCLAVDASGTEVDGDQIMAILAVGMKERGALKEDTLVATVMSNLGLYQAMEQRGISIKQTAVGDRYVLEEMRASGYNLGGEQSGHVILTDVGTTGDGVLTGLMLAAQVASSGSTMAQLATVMTRLPQHMVNVKGVDKAAASTHPVVLNAISEAELELGDNGRVLLRPSGTEPVVRVMAEAPTAELAQQITARLAAVVQTELAL
ncbi:phosphoglucosamine mutase [Yimella sp. cx-51]|uniref:phosphoglucosamine mutase n=1 Tax=Yimella sp. cx-51 TaxID=2770551 RepID=UPI00165E40DA|nr:phosphoglucosamine mutase [Yimella sp. cx-51]MBC9955966.1 phosphoglucosamine mutase [Yimella sp. cx-51]QTH37494.1 phosphoglucosamine mutase [Yimella sp. cx-51]